MDTVVRTKYGELQGITNGKVRIFRGIPYAAPPVGDLRFRAPREHDAWEGVRPADKFTPICPQIMQMQVVPEPIDEDCLYLNVYTPENASGLPVTVFIHGGAFVGGSGSQQDYDASNFAKDGIVFVTLNYRLAALGGLNLTWLDDSFENNLHLKDQLFALKWVKENIAAFGGNPEDITLMGQSAGAISINALLCVPKAKSYFNKAVLMSSFPTLFQTPQESEKYARGFANFLGFSSAREFLNIDARELTDKLKRYLSTFDRRLGLDCVMPVADGVFLPEKPLECVRRGNANYVPLLFGYTTEEAEILFRIRKLYKIGWRENNEYLSKLGDKENEARALYGRGIKNGAQIFRDELLKLPIQIYAAENAAHAPTWLYRFDYKTPFLRLTCLKSFHCLDLCFAFGNFSTKLTNIIFPIFRKRKAQREVSRRMHSDFVKFIKTAELDWDTVDKNFAAKVYAKHDNIEYDVASAKKREFFKMTLNHTEL